MQVPPRAEVGRGIYASHTLSAPHFDVASEDFTHQDSKVSLQLSFFILELKAHDSSRCFGIWQLGDAVLSATTPKYPKESVSETYFIRTL